jgi:hypothetical protein
MGEKRHGEQNRLAHHQPHPFPRKGSGPQKKNIFEEMRKGLREPFEQWVGFIKTEKKRIL